MVKISKTAAGQRRAGKNQRCGNSEERQEELDGLLNAASFRTIPEDATHCAEDNETSGAVST